jgi:hypothetical protein
MGQRRCQVSHDGDRVCVRCPPIELGVTPPEPCQYHDNDDHNHNVRHEGVKTIFHQFGSVPNSQVGPDPNNNTYHYNPLPESATQWHNNTTVTHHIDGCDRSGITPGHAPPQCTLDTVHTDTRGDRSGPIPGHAPHHHEQAANLQSTAVYLHLHTAGTCLPRDPTHPLQDSPKEQVCSPRGNQCTYTSTLQAPAIPRESYSP